jgi:hypothetical protein
MVEDHSISISYYLLFLRLSQETDFRSQLSVSLAFRPHTSYYIYAAKTISNTATESSNPDYTGYRSICFHYFSG